MNVIAERTEPTARRPLWRDTAPPEPQRPSLTEAREADVAIVGGGYTGLSAALHLAEAGARTVLLEADDVAAGASGRNGGSVVPGLKHDPAALERIFGERVGGAMFQAAGAAPDLVFDLIARHGIACDARRPGWILAAHSQRAMAVVAARAADWERRGVKSRLLDAGEAARLIGTERYVGAWVDPRGGNIQPLAYARGLAQAAERAGATIFIDSRARALSRADGRWRVTTERGEVRAPVVVLGTNGYTDGLWPGLRRSVIPVYSMQIATRPLSENLRRSILPEGHAVSDTFRLLKYFRLDRDGRLLVGGRGPLAEQPEPTDGAPLIALLKTLFPQVGEPDIDHIWAGRVAITPDHLPHLFELAPGVYAGLGYNGRGIAMATLMGRTLAALARGADMADLPFPVTPLRKFRLHALRRPAVAATAAVYRLLDRLERP